MKRHLIIAFAITACAFASSPVAAQDEWETQVRELLARAGSTLADRGFTSSHKVYTGSLGQGAIEDVRVPLDADSQYVIQAVCDTDCSDLDLVLLNETGVEVDSDVLDDDHPSLTVNPTRSGNYLIRVAMLACAAEPCAFAVGIYSQ